jgi:protoporphyrinogen oxidase
MQFNLTDVIPPMPNNVDSNSKSHLLSEKTVVIGGGPAGLTAAYELGKAGVPCVVLEKDSDVGGISRTVEYKGYHFDIGGHRFYTKVDAVNAMWHEVMPHGEFLRRRRLSRIYYNRQFFQYPIQAKEALQKLGLFNSALIVLSYFRYKLFPMRPEDTFEANICNRFGRRLFETFFKHYTEKVWGVPCSQITADWANQRIKGFGLGQAMKKAVLGQFQPYKTNSGIKTLIDSFEYPRFGPGQLWRRVAQLILEGGGDVRPETAVTHIFHNHERILAVEAKHAGAYERIEGKHFISSMPIRSLIHRLDPPAPQEIIDAANRLQYRDFLTVALIINRAHLFDDNWIYIHEPSVKMGRIQNFKNWSPDMVADPNKTCLGLEYFCFEGDGLWGMSDVELVELGKHEIEVLGLAKATQVEDGAVVRQPKAYPVYDAHYEAALKTIRTWLKTLPNLQLVGRNGMHRYNNQDHSMLTAMLAARNILGEDFDLWQVNDDQEYGEEINHTTQSTSASLSTRYGIQANQTQPHVPTLVVKDSIEHNLP